MSAPRSRRPRQDEVIARIRQIAEAAGGTFEAVRRLGPAQAGLRDPPPGRGVLPRRDLHDDRAEALDEISRVLRITDDVLRHMAVRRTGRSSGPVEEPVPVS